MPMLPDAVTRWASRLGRIGEGALHTSRLNIGARLLLCFACIVTADVESDAIVRKQPVVALDGLPDTADVLVHDRLVLDQ